MVRYVPQSLGGAQYFGAFSGYTVKAILPDAFLKAATTRAWKTQRCRPTARPHEA